MKKRTLSFIVTGVVAILWSCTNFESEIITSERQEILTLEEEYGLRKIENPASELMDLKATSIDDLKNFLFEYNALKGARLPIKIESNANGELVLALDEERMVLPMVKSSSETVHLSDTAPSSLGLLKMNVWLDVANLEVVDSSLTGITLFDRWEHKSADVSLDGDIVSFTVYGVWYYKLFVDGIGEFYSYSAHFSGTYDIVQGIGSLRF